MHAARKGALVLFCLIWLSHPARACGQERWQVKTLTDGGTGDIEHAPRNATVAELGGLAAPSQQTLRQNGATRFSPVETTTYRVRALLLGYRKEDDEDLHLVLADPDHPDRTMIAEIPAASCVGDGAFGAKLQRIRSRLVSRFGAPGVHTKRLPHPARVTIRGIGFFDIEHPTPQDGVAPNGIELHPVLGLRVSGQ